MNSDQGRREGYANILLEYILSNYPSTFTKDTLPRDESLVDLEIVDSAGFIEILSFIETTWDILITDEDITKERMGSLNKIVSVVDEYINAKQAT